MRRCSKMRWVSVIATSWLAERFSTTKVRRASGEAAATWTWKSSPPARKNTLSTPGSPASHPPNSPIRARALPWSRTTTIACSGRPSASGEISAWKPRITPVSCSRRTRIRHVDGAMPTRAASVLFGVRASSASIAISRRSVSSSSGAPPGAGARGPGRMLFRTHRLFARSNRRIVAHQRARRTVCGELAPPRKDPRQSSGPPEATGDDMKVGVPKEVKNHEYRVAITPIGVHELTAHDHEVFVQQGAGEGSSISDDEYVAAGAKIVPDADEAWGVADMVLKVKEPVAEEYHRLREDLTLFTYLHLAADQPLTEELVKSKVTGIAYETVQLPSGGLPLLYPMSEVAGCLAPQVGAHSLMKAQGGRGVLMGGVGGVANAKVVILGAGVSGQNAANIARGMGADVTLLDTDLDKLRMSFWRYENQVHGLASNRLTVQQQVQEADMVIGAVLIPGAAAPKLVSNQLVSQMKPGSVLVDIAIDQGGCFEDSHPTTHADPTYRVHDSVFYCVANMPGAVPNTSTYALTNSTLPYAVKLANQGWRDALRSDHALGLGLNTHDGHVTYAGVAEAHGMASVGLDEALS